MGSCIDSRKGFIFNSLDAIFKVLKIFFSDIHCLRTETMETFTAFLRIPNGFGSIPALEDSKRQADSTLCLLTKTNIENVIALDISSFHQCGVRECRGSEEEGDGNPDSPLLCVTLRFPMLPGLKMPEDEVIDIKCKPQDHAIAGSNVINFQENA